MSFERANVRAAAGYLPGEQPEDQGVIKLNTNENPYPPAPEVGEALRSFPVDGLRRYPPPTALAFRRTAGALLGVEADSLVATNGGDELLRLALATFVEPGERIAVTVPSYSLYPVLARLHGAHTIEIGLTPGWGLPQDLAARLNRAGAKLAFVVNPHAPSGHLTPAESIRRLAAEFAGILVLDEAYVDFVDPGLEYDAVGLTRSLDNLLILRTLSKGYSLAGLRFGFGIGAPPLIRPIQTKTKDSYNTDGLSQQLAIAAVRAQDHARATWARVRRERERLRRGLDELGWLVPPSHANFVLAQTSSRWGSLSAARTYQQLKARGILVRYFDEPRLDDKLRITVGTAEENDALLAALGELRS